MQKRSSKILNELKGRDKYTILTFPTHERTQSLMGHLPHQFYMMSNGDHIKPWTFQHAPLPDNHVLIPKRISHLPIDVQIDIVLSQSKFAHIQLAKQYADEMNVPLINIEHTWPPDTYTQKRLDIMKSMSGDINVFISAESAKAWGFGLEDPSVRVLHHGVDTDLFLANIQANKKKEILTVANDFIKRNYFLGYDIFTKVTNGLPVYIVGDTEGLSKPAGSIGELIDNYQSHYVYFNSSIRSPIPMSVLEAMACGLCIVTTATCMLPEVIIDGYNGFISNDEEYLREKLEWCLENPGEAMAMGMNARETILTKFSLKSHLENLDNIFKEAYKLCK